MHKSMEEAKKLNQQSKQGASLFSGGMNAVNREADQMNFQVSDSSPSGSGSDQMDLEETKQQNRRAKRNQQE